MPLISIVIPTFNRAELVQRAIDSVVGQGFDDLEVVVSDNLSTDRTCQTAASFDDARVRYVRPERHMVLPDHWEFARAQATGRHIMMLSDDDALVPGALARFAEEQERHAGDFCFCSLAVYRDGTFPVPQANSLEVPSFTGRTEIVDPAVFISTLMAFKPRYNMHPSGYLFAATLAEQIAARNGGHFFHTLGVEYFAWPVAVARARRVVHIDLPLVVIGRTEKSWGTNMVLLNPGQSKINELLNDAQTERAFTPFSNFTLTNLTLEALLTAKARFPNELGPFEVDMRRAVRSTRKELDRRRAQGVDVSIDVAELDDYVARNPALADGTAHAPPPLADRLRSRARTARAILTGRGRRQFGLLGETEGFADATDAADVLARRIAPRRPTVLRRSGNLGGRTPADA